MKHLFFLSLVLMFSSTAFCQTTPAEKPVYLRYPVIPVFKTYQAPDSTVFTQKNLKKGKATLFFIFSPDCGHCKRETELILANMGKFKNVEILMITYLPFSEMMAFYKHYRIDRYPQITMARDANFFFPVFFAVRNFPSMYFYDKKGKFKKFLEGDVRMNTMEDALKMIQ